MMTCKFKSLDGSIRELDLEAVYDVLFGFSARRPGWAATVVYEPVDSALIELRNSPADEDDECITEAEEITDQYFMREYRVTEAQLKALRLHPERWKVICQDYPRQNTD